MLAIDRYSGREEIFLKGYGETKIGIVDSVKSMMARCYNPICNRSRSMRQLWKLLAHSAKVWMLLESQP